MATLPSPDPERYSDVHLLRRTDKKDPTEKWEALMESGRAPAFSYAEKAAEEEERIRKFFNASVGTGSVLFRFANALKWRAFQRASLEEELSTTRRILAQETSRANTWRGIALVIAIILLLVGLSNWAGRGREVTVDEIQMHS